MEGVNTLKFPSSHGQTSSSFHGSLEAWKRLCTPMFQLRWANPRHQDTCHPLRLSNTPPTATLSARAHKPRIPISVKPQLNWLRWDGIHRCISQRFLECVYVGLALRSTFPAPCVDVSCSSLRIYLAALPAQGGHQTAGGFVKLLMQAGFSAHAHAGDLETGDEDRNDGAERQRKGEEGSILRSCTQCTLLIP